MMSLIWQYEESLHWPWDPGLVGVQECNQVFQVTILTDESYISKVIILISFMISLRWRVTRPCVCPGPGPPGPGVQECGQVFQVTTTTLWCRRRGNELISGVITFIKTEDRLWHFISETGPLCPNTDKTWFINPAPPSGICPCYHPSSPELAVAPCLMFSQLIVPGLASQGSLSRSLTTSSVSWHHDRWTERQQPANIGWSDLLIMVVSEEERLVTC